MATDLGRWNEHLRRALAAKEADAILGGLPPTQGGCWIVARALQLWLDRGELKIVWGLPTEGDLLEDEPIPHHVVLEYGPVLRRRQRVLKPLYIDGDGAATLQQLLHKAEVRWSIPEPFVDRHFNDRALRQHRTRPPGHAAARLAKYLKERVHDHPPV